MTRQRESTTRGGFARVLLVLLATVLGAPGALKAEGEDPGALRVCADPSNLPFSNQAGEGFENSIAELLAAALGLPLHYTWFPQSMGFVRNTIKKRECDLVVGVPAGYELLRNTAPYYRSTYALIYRPGSDLDVSSLDDPRLKGKRLGVIAGTPPASPMARHGLLALSRPYHLLADTRFHHPAKQMVDDVAAGALDGGILWGPIAGYFSARVSPALAVSPLVSTPGDVPMDYSITMGVRYRDTEWEARISDLIRQNQPAIDAILHQYGVPLLDDQGRPITP